MSRDLARAAHRNMRHVYSLLGEHLAAGATREFGGVTAAASGLPLANFNRVLVFEPPATQDLEAAVAWMRDRAAPFQVTVAGDARPAVASRLTDLGLAKDSDQPAMARGSLAALPEPDAPVKIAPVTDPADVDAYVAVMSAVYGTPEDVAEQLVADPAGGSEDLTTLIGRRDGEAVASGQLILAGDVAGVYSIGVREEHRRQGIAEAMSLEILRRGRAAGCEVAALQSSAMAVPVYEGLGFQTVATYHDYLPEE